MNRLFNALTVFAAALAGMIGAPSAFAQSTLFQTTLGAAVTSTSAKTVQLASCTPIVAPNPITNVSSAIYIDTELMAVNAVTSLSSGCLVNVTRGVNGTRAQTHAAAATVYANPANQPVSVSFVGFPQWGSCTAANIPVLPVVDYVDQYIENCVNGQWTLLISGTVNYPQTIVLPSDYTNATTTMSNVFSSGIPVHAGLSYTLRCEIVWQGSASTTGPKYQFTGPSSPTKVAASAISAVTASTFTQAVATAFSSAMANAGTITTATNFRDSVTLGLVNGANSGTLMLQAAANGSGTLTIKAGSFCVQQ